VCVCVCVCVCVWEREREREREREQRDYRHWALWGNPWHIWVYHLSTDSYQLMTEKIFKIFFLQGKNNFFFCFETWWPQTLAPPASISCVWDYRHTPPHPARLSIFNIQFICLFRMLYFSGMVEKWDLKHWFPYSNNGL
jgi:hypothetical protein